MGKEILTLQFGNFSNYIGTHFWNLETNSIKRNEKRQPSTNIFFRDLISCNEDKKYIPRTIIVEKQRNIIFSHRKKECKNNFLIKMKNSLQFNWEPKNNLLKHRVLTIHPFQMPKKECSNKKEFK